MAEMCVTSVVQIERTFYQTNRALRGTYVLAGD